MRSFLADIERLSGDLPAAERILREANDELGALGAEEYRTSVACQLAYVLEQQHSDDEAESYLDEVDRIASTDDIDPQVRSRSVRARILARRGTLDEAERLAHNAVERSSRTTLIAIHGEALLARVSCAHGSGSDALR
jgi:hypothetical protein